MGKSGVHLAAGGSFAKGKRFSAETGVDRSVIMKITGHKSLSMFERYNTIDREGAQDALKRLDEFLTKPSWERRLLQNYFKARIPKPFLL